ncbi:MAG TPA: hypothetical protein PLP17_08505 [Oligoflexia bacterium]|nr:hypothetical protein [Oligoflexia bacterium]
MTGKTGLRGPKTDKARLQKNKAPSFKRASLPQIRAVDIDRFIEHLQTHGIAVERGNISVDALEPIQYELEPEKVAAKARKIAAGEIQLKPFIVSIDGYIIDSHHQLAALKHIRPKEPVCIRLVHLTINELIDQARTFSAMIKRS